MASDGQSAVASAVAGVPQQRYQAGYNRPWVDPGVMQGGGGGDRVRPPTFNPDPSPFFSGMSINGQPLKRDQMRVNPQLMYGPRLADGGGGNVTPPVYAPPPAMYGNPGLTINGEAPTRAQAPGNPMLIAPPIGAGNQGAPIRSPQFVAPFGTGGMTVNGQAIRPVSPFGRPVGHTQAPATQNPAGGGYG
jgi:hypothetical protein